MSFIFFGGSSSAPPVKSSVFKVFFVSHTVNKNDDTNGDGDGEIIVCFMYPQQITYKLFVFT